MPKTVANWGNYPLINAEEISFSTQDQLVALSSSHPHLISRGYGRCYGDASLAPVMISTMRFDKLLSFDDKNGVIDCQSGLTFDKILETIMPRGWFLPVTPGTKFVTTGGAVASDIHGKNHHKEGSFSNHVIEMDVMVGNGTVLTCSPNENTDLFWATCGGMGLTGVITRVKFQLKAIESAYIKNVQVKARDLEEILDLFDQYKHLTYSVAWIDCLKGGKGLGRSILLAGEHAKKNELSDKQTKNALQYSGASKLNIPLFFPSFALDTWSVKAFNFLYYQKNLKKTDEKVVSYEPFFYPLDAILNWNKIYGKRGFVQYQFVLPLMGSYRGLVKILSKIQQKGMGSFLAVLKLFGKQDDLMSFPMEGYTLALDFPVKAGLMEFLDELDEIVIDFGGRIYLTKDARMKADVFQKSYKNLPDFVEILHKYDPERIFRSEQAIRLNVA